MRKVNDVMPLHIARYLADTAHLSNAMSGSYLHALMHQWLVGPLPNDMSECARIMKIEGVGAEDKAAALLKSFFILDEQGSWMQLRAEAIKREAVTKAIRFSNRAVRANAVRWKGHERKWPPRRPSSEEIEAPTRTPTRTPKGILGESLGSPLGVPEDLELEVQNQPISSLRSLGGEPSAGAGRTHTQPERGRKTGEAASPVERPGRAAKGVRPSEVPRGAASPVSSRKPAGKKSAPTPTKPAREVDPRFRPFRREVLAYWKAQNPGGLSYGWSEEDGRALNNLLRRYKALQFDKFRRLLSNRAQSDAINPSESPVRWLGKLMDYLDGPLDRYGRPRKR